MARHVDGAGVTGGIGPRRFLVAGLVAVLLAFVALPAKGASAAVGAERPISDAVMQSSTQSFSQRQADAVFDGTRWFVVWAESRGGGFDIMGARVGVDGGLPDGDGITISTGVDNGTSATLNTFSPSVAVDDNGTFLVAWQDDAPGGADVFAARVSPAGRVLDPVAIVIDADADNDQGPSVAWNGDVFLVAYQRAGVSQQVVTFGALITSAGVVQPLGLIADTSGPAVAVSGSTFLVVGGTGIDGIVGRRFDGNGIALDAQPFVIAAQSLPGTQAQANVAGGADGWLAVWTDKRNGDTNADIFAARVTPSGTVTEPNGFPVSGAIGNQDVPEVGVVGNQALVLWRDFGDGEQDVFGAHVSLSSGTVAEPNGFAVSATPAGDGPSAVAAGPGSNHASFTTRVAPEAPYGGAQRAFVRQISPK